jgi:hypothetical protein
VGNTSVYPRAPLPSVDVPTNTEVALIREFLANTLSVYKDVVGKARIDNHEVRGALFQAVKEYESVGAPRLLEAYARLDKDFAQDSGLTGEQLEAKVSLAKLAADELRLTQGTLWTSRVRRWLKRVKVLLGSLAKLVPPAEALIELVDLLDAALDR